MVAAAVAAEGDECDGADKDVDDAGYPDTEDAKGIVDEDGAA